MTTKQFNQLMEQLDQVANVAPTKAYQITWDGKEPKQIPLSQALGLNEALVPYPRDQRGRITVDHELMEAGGEASTANFPDLLRSGIQFDVFSTYAETPVIYPQIANVMNSNKQQEEYLKDAGIGLAPIVAEGEPYPEASIALSDGVIIKNYKRGFVIPVTMEMQMFDQVGKVRDIFQMMGRAMRLTEEQAFMDVLTTAANYTRNSTTGDNDGGANQQTLTFSPTGLIEAFYVLTTMKDRHSGMYLGVVPNTLVIAPQLWWFAKQLLTSPEVMRAHADDDSTVITVEKYGQGTTNSFYGAVQNIIVSPQFGSNYEWALLEAKRPINFQRVKPVEVMQESPTAQTSQYVTRDVIRYRVSSFFGVGMKDDRYAFFSDSSTAPTVD